MKTEPIADSVPKVNNELAVGSDLKFQGRFLKFQGFIWVILTLFLLASFSGILGRGPLASTTQIATDGSFDVKYEWVQRYGSPSMIMVRFQPAAIKNGEVKLWVSDSLLKPLGNQRVIPQPVQSIIGGGGVLYTFPVNAIPASIEFQDQPGAMGSTKVRVRVPGMGHADIHILVMP